MEATFARIRRYGPVLPLLVVAGLIWQIPSVKAISWSAPLIAYLVVLIASWWGGTGPGLLLTASIALISWPRHPEPWHYVRQALFLAGGIPVSLLVGSLHAARRKAEAQSDELRRARDESQRARRVAEEALHAKDLLLKMLSHELRTPLTPPLLVASSLLADPALPAELRELLEVIHQGIALEARLVDDLLDAARSETGPIRLHPVRLDAHDAVRRAISACQPEVIASGVRLELDLSAPAPIVEADPARIQQVIWNLVKNACQHTPAGNVVSVRSCVVEGSRLVIEVADQGAGMAPETLARVFDPFIRGPEGPARSAGLGLGLAIANRIAEAHHGRLSATSDGPNRGSTFILELPLAGQDFASTVGAISSPLTTLPAKRILLVDDDPATLWALSRSLRRAGHEVETAESVASGVVAVEREEFDLIISDVGLPDGTGYDLIQKITERRPIPSIALTGYGADGDILQTRAAGFSAHLTKPIEFEALEATIRQVMQTPP